MSSDIMNLVIALPKFFTLEFWDFSSFTLNELFPKINFSRTIEFQRPIFLLFIIPALILSIIPFFRLRKNRRRASKHIIPFIIHLALIVVITSLMTGIRITHTDTIPPETVIVVACDVSDSNEKTKAQMNEYIKYLEKEAEDTKIGVILFANGQMISSEVGETKDDYFDVDYSSLGLDSTNIKGALDFAKEQFPDNNRVNKRVILLSDGRQTVQNAWIGVENLFNDRIRLDGVYFDMLSANDVKEAQIVSFRTNNTNVKSGNMASMTVNVNSNSDIDGKIEIHEGENIVYEKSVSLKSGSNAFQFEYLPEGEGLHTVYVQFVPDDIDEDVISQNNQLYSWFNVEGTPKVLVVDGDSKQASNPNISDIQSVIPEGYESEVISPEMFPVTMQELLKYDEVVLMNVNFDDMPSNSPDMLTRYVQDVGRGLFVSAGSNIYDQSLLTRSDSDEVVQDSPIADLLPVELTIRETKQKIGFVLTVDLSSSMREAMGSTNRYEVVKESAKKCLDALDGENAYIGFVLFDNSASVAIPMTGIEQKDWLLEEIDRVFEDYFYLHDKDGNRVKKNDNINKRIEQADGTFFNVNSSTPADFDGYVIKAYGTNYRWATSAASNLLTEFDADIKQMVFISDGEPSDKGSGYLSTISSLARQGIVTYSLGIGNNLNSNALTELGSIATNGRGEFKQVADPDNLDSTLFELARIEGKFLNEADVRGEPISPVISDTSSKVLAHVRDVIDLGGYYGSTLKEDASAVLTVDDNRPIYAEWQVGLGRVSIFMSDLSNVKWTGEMWNTESSGRKDGVQLISNMLVSCVNDSTGVSGIQYNVDRNGTNATVNATLLNDLRDGEEIVAKVTDMDGNVVDTVKLLRKNFGRYSQSVSVPDTEQVYDIVVTIQKSSDTSDIQDSIEFRVVGTYGTEYDVFAVTNGQNALNDWAIRTGGIRFDNSSEDENLKFRNLGTDEVREYVDSFETPAAIIILALFVLDIIFRHVNISIKKKKEMTDEEQLASMRGR